MEFRRAALGGTIRDGCADRRARWVRSRTDARGRALRVADRPSRRVIRRSPSGLSLQKREDQLAELGRLLDMGQVPTAIDDFQTRSRDRLLVQLTDL